MGGGAGGRGLQTGAFRGDHIGVGERCELVVVHHHHYHQRLEGVGAWHAAGGGHPLPPEVGVRLDVGVLVVVVTQRPVAMSPAEVGCVRQRPDKRTEAHVICKRNLQHAKKKERRLFIS